MNKITSEHKPNITEDLGTGWYYYNYNIQPTEYDDFDYSEDEPKVKKVNGYTWLQVRINGVPTYKECVETIIREYISQTEEFDLINSANKDILANNLDSNNIKEYKEYLQLVDEIKANVKKDFNK